MTAMAKKSGGDPPRPFVHIMGVLLHRTVAAAWGMLLALPPPFLLVAAPQHQPSTTAGTRLLLLRDGDHAAASSAVFSEFPASLQAGPPSRHRLRVNARTSS